MMGQPTSHPPRATPLPKSPCVTVTKSRLTFSIGPNPDTLSPNNPFIPLYYYVSRKSRDGRVLGPQEKISRQQALRIATNNNAFATWEEKVKGSIEPGKLADFLVLSADFMTIPEDEILKLYPMATYVGGRKVYEAPEAGGAF